MPRRISPRRSTNLSTATAGKGAKSASSTSVRIDLAELGGDDLHGPLVKLGRPLDAHVIADVERFVERFVGVPDPGGDRSAAVGEFHLEIEIPVAVRAELLVAHDEDLVDRLLMAQLTDVASRHGGSRQELDGNTKSPMNCRARKNPPQGGRGGMLNAEC